jgi:hypothetical protein
VKRVHLLLPAVLALASCNKPSEPDRSGGTAPPSTAAEAPRTTGGAVTSRPSGATDVAWDAPAGWTKAERTPPMRKASYTVPRAAGDAEDPELTVSNAGGAVDQNVARWAIQLDRKLSEVKRTERTVNGLKVTMVEIHGDYTGMPTPASPKPTKKPGFALLGAIVDSSPLTFFKLIGPEKSVVAAQRDFDKLVDSLRAK